MVGVRNPVRPRPRLRDDRVLVERKRRVPGARQRERIGDRLRALGVDGGVPGALLDAQDDVVRGRDRGEQVGGGTARTADLEVWCARAADGAAPEKRAADVGVAAASSADDPLRRCLERRVRGREDTRATENVERAVAPGDVDLVPGRPVERPARVRADLGLDPEPAEQPERPPRHGSLGNVEMDRELAVSEQVQAAGGVEETRELRQPVAVAPRLDRGELAPDLVRERHLRAPAAGACTRRRATRSRRSPRRRRLGGRGRSAGAGSGSRTRRPRAAPAAGRRARRARRR